MIAAKIEPVVEYLLSPDNLDSGSDDDMLKMCDVFGEAYGTLISYIIGFDKRFKAWYNANIFSSNLIFSDW